MNVTYCFYPSSSSSGSNRDELEGQGRHRHLVAARIPGQLDLRCPWRVSMAPLGDENSDWDGISVDWVDSDATLEQHLVLCLLKKA